MREASSSSRTFGALAARGGGAAALRWAAAVAAFSCAAFFSSSFIVWMADLKGLLANAGSFFLGPLRCWLMAGGLSSSWASVGM